MENQAAAHLIQSYLSFQKKNTILILWLCNIVAYLPWCGPTFGTYDELAVMDESGTSPDSIPSGLSHEPANKINIT